MNKSKTADDTIVQDYRDVLYPELQCYACDAKIWRDNPACWSLREGQQWHEGYTDISRGGGLIICPDCIERAFGITHTYTDATD